MTDRDIIAAAVEAVREFWLNCEDPLATEEAAAVVAAVEPLIRAAERAKIEATIREIHAPFEAVHEPSRQHLQVCTGCGSDNGNWARWPCRTIRALEAK